MNNCQPHHPLPIVWAIGGVDPTGLAGISADNRAVAVSGAYCVNIVTCVTAQNSNAFYSLNDTKTALLDQQWQALMEQCPPQVIKIGLLANSTQVTWLADKLASLRQFNPTLWVIYDPVIRASSDAAPILRSMLEAITTELLPQVDLLTPNLHEAMRLSGELPTSQENLSDYCQQLADKFSCQVYLKGGHISDVFANESDITDFYARARSSQRSEYIAEPAKSFVLTPIKTQHAHRRGSGCILASLIAGYVANDYRFCDAIVLSCGVMRKAYQTAGALGNSAGGAISLTADISIDDLPEIKVFNAMVFKALSRFESAFAPCPLDLGLYPVVDTIEWLTRLLKQGVKTIQLRAKDLTSSDVEPLIIEAIRLGSVYNARVFINDYWQLAVKHQAYGVHLGQEDMAVADLNAINMAGVRLGLSTHGVFEALWAKQFMPSYIALGHIFATQTKDMPSKPQGIAKLLTQVRLFDGVMPVTAIGGISAQRVQGVVDTKISSVALVTAITKACDPEQVTQQLIELIGVGAAHE